MSFPIALAFLSYPSISVKQLQMGGETGADSKSFYRSSAIEFPVLIL